MQVRRTSIVGEGLQSGKSVKRIRCLCRARRARSRSVVYPSGAVVVVVGVVTYARLLQLGWVAIHMHPLPSGAN